MNEAKAEEPWINRNIINFAYKKFCEKKKITKDPSPETEAYNSLNKQPLKCKGGRLKGSTLLLKHHGKESVIAAKNEINCMYHEKKKECNKRDENIPVGWLKETIENICVKRRLSSNLRIPRITIRNHTKSILMTESGSETLMAPIEPHLVELICAMGQIR